MPATPLPLQRGSALTPMAFVKAILLGYEKYGIDPAPMLARAGITRRALAARGGRITGRQMELVSEVAMRELDDEALGWFSRRLRWGTYGLLFRASLPSPTLGIAWRRWCRHHNLLTDDISLQLTVQGATATVSIAEHVPLGPMRAFCLLSILRYAHGYACWTIDSQIHLNRVCLPHPAPADAAVYPVVFGREVEFGAPDARFSFDASYLQLRPVRDDQALRQLLRRPLPLSLRSYRRDRMTVSRVRSLLRDDLARFATVTAVARHLGMSARTLHRQFEDQGSSFQQLKDEVRRDLALELLHRSDKPVKQIAQALGYASEKSFFRVFVKWTGQTPGAARRSADTDAN